MLRFCQLFDLNGDQSISIGDIILMIVYGWPFALVQQVADRCFGRFWP